MRTYNESVYIQNIIENNPGPLQELTADRIIQQEIPGNDQLEGIFCVCKLFIVQYYGIRRAKLSLFFSAIPNLLRKVIRIQYCGS